MSFFVLFLCPKYIFTQCSILFLGVFYRASKELLGGQCGENFAEIDLQDLNKMVFKVSYLSLPFCTKSSRVHIYLFKLV